MSFRVAPSSRPYSGQASVVSTPPTNPSLFLSRSLIAGAKCYEWCPSFTLCPSASFRGQTIFRPRKGSPAVQIKKPAAAGYQGCTKSSSLSSASMPHRTVCPSNEATPKILWSISIIAEPDREFRKPLGPHLATSSYLRRYP